MRLRYLPPVRSPVTLGAVLAGLAPAASAPEQVRARIAAEYAPDDVLLTDSGTSALRLALAGAALSAGRADALVAMPAYCCYDIATAADGAGVRVALYDLDPATLSPDPGSLERALALGARAVVVAHLYGFPVDLGMVRRLAAQARALLIEDAAQGVGGSYEGRALGAHGELAILSFGRGKGRTGGGGGALLARGARGLELLERVRSLAGPSRGGRRSALRLAAQWLLARPSLYRLPASLPFLGLGETPYHQPWEPRAMAPGPAAALLWSWEASGREAARRRATGTELIRQLTEGRKDEPAGHWGRPVRPVAGAQPGYLRFPLVLDAPRDLRPVRGLGIMPGYPLALPDLPGFGSRCAVTGEAHHGARTLAARLCTLPTHSWVRTRDLDGMERWLFEGTLPAATP